MKLVHKDRQLELVGWYTLLPRSGPTMAIVPLHDQILHSFNESAVLLAFHPEEVLNKSVGGKLPLTIYESAYEVDDSVKGKAPATDGEDRVMKDDGPGGAVLKTRFRELPYSVEMSEAEMISIDFVARGAANATTVERAAPPVESNAKGKRRAAAPGSEKEAAERDILPPEDQELLRSITSRSNAVKMLHSRIELIIKYLEKLPPSYLAADGQAGTAAASAAGQVPAKKASRYMTPSHTILRSIQALVHRLPLLVPTSEEALEHEMLSESNDVNLVFLFNDVLQHVQEMRQAGKKFQIVDQAKVQKERAPPSFGGQTGSHGAPLNVVGVGDLMR